MQETYHRALYSLGPDVGCYAPPKLLENELKESLQVMKYLPEGYKSIECPVFRPRDSRTGATRWITWMEPYK